MFSIDGPFCKIIRMLSGSGGVNVVSAQAKQTQNGMWPTYDNRFGFDRFDTAIIAVHPSATGCNKCGIYKTRQMNQPISD